MSGTKFLTACHNNHHLWLTQSAFKGNCSPDYIKYVRGRNNLNNNNLLIRVYCWISCLQPLKQFRWLNWKPNWTKWCIYLPKLFFFHILASESGKRTTKWELRGMEREGKRNSAAKIHATAGTHKNTLRKAFALAPTQIHASRTYEPLADYSCEFLQTRTS